MTPKKAFDDHVRHSLSRGISFNLSYEDWLEMWLVSGKWPNRGKESGQYVMCRFGDVGPYSKRNCYIGTVEQNNRDRWKDIEKIDDSKSAQIYEMYTTTNATQKEIGKHFSVDQSYVSRIINKLRKKNAR